MKNFKLSNLNKNELLVTEDGQTFSTAGEVAAHAKTGDERYTTRKWHLVKGMDEVGEPVEIDIKPERSEKG